MLSRMTEVGPCSFSRYCWRVDLHTPDISEALRIQTELPKFCIHRGNLAEQQVARLRTPRLMMKTSNTKIAKPPENKISARWCTVNFKRSRGKAICKPDSGVSDESLSI